MPPRLATAAILLACLLLHGAGAQTAGACNSGGEHLVTSTGACAPCPSGHACPPGAPVTTANLGDYACPAGSYQPMQGQTGCIPCPPDTACPLEGTVNFTPCDATDSAPPSSTACRFCTNPAYFSTGPDGCTRRTVCGPGKYTASQAPGSDTVCADLTPYEPVPVSPVPTCVVGGSRLCPGALERYISRMETPTSDRELWVWAPCPANHYLAQPVVADSAGLILQGQECRPYTNCKALNMYMVIDGTKTEDQDNVCAAPRVCKPWVEYTVRPALVLDGKVGQDAECRPYTRCAADEYVAVRGNATHDNVCRAWEDCTLPLEARYQVSPARDAPEKVHNALGQDAVCANYSSCPPGHFPNSTGAPTADRQCAPCPRGMRGTDGVRCEYCALGATYSPVEGATSCVACTACSNVSYDVSRIELGWANCSANSTACPVATRSQCTLVQDATCMVCPQPSWDLSPGGVCTACSPGYHFAGADHSGVVSGSIAESERCLPCTPNFYCPGGSAFHACQDLRVYEVAAAAASSPPSYAVVPSSPSVARFPRDCECNVYGGFSGTADGMLGCRPCPDGHFAPPDAPGCEACPAGTYAARREAPDRLACPVDDLTRSILVFAGDPGYSGVSAPPCTNQTVTVGAVGCTPCPPHLPWTKGPGASSRAQCTRCPAGQFLARGSPPACRNCSVCPSGAGNYEAVPCADDADTICGTCAPQGCLDNEYFTGCTRANVRGCTQCTGAPAGSHYITRTMPALVELSPGSEVALPRGTASSVGAGECPWACDGGMYYDGEACVPCTAFDATTCPAGVVLTPCGEDADAACDTACERGNMPILHAAWYRVYRNATGHLVRDDAQRANEGCAWECERGYVHVRTDGGLDLCVARGGTLALRYLGLAGA